MGKVIAFLNLSLDGVMQAPARPDEDSRDGFTHGGWAAPYAAMSAAGEVMGNAGSLLLGRRTYEDFYNVWPKRKDSPYSAYMDNVQKYVVSRTLKEPLPWQNSTLLSGNLVNALTELKKSQNKDLVIMGSGELIQSLMPDNVVDEFVLLIHPLVLGQGRRLFADGVHSTPLELIRTKTTDKGVIAATYRPITA